MRWFNQDTFPVVILFVTTIAFFVGNIVEIFKLQEFKMEAVKRGFAFWSVDDYGNSTFEWKKND